MPWKYAPHILSKRLRYSQCEGIRDHTAFILALDTELQQRTLSSKFYYVQPPTKSDVLRST